MIVVSDTTPLISLMKAARLGILERLYSEVLIPQAVYEELTVNPRYAREAETIRNSSFIRVVPVGKSGAVERLRSVSGLDLGESEAIVCAEDYKADILLMDEEAGRRVAKSKGLRVRGTIGVLLLAYDKKLLTGDEIEDAVRLLRTGNRRISETLFRYAVDYVRK